MSESTQIRVAIATIFFRINVLNEGKLFSRSQANIFILVYPVYFASNYDI